MDDDDWENELYSLGCRQDVVDGHIIKQQHKWLPILQFTLWQNGVIDYTGLFIVNLMYINTYIFSRF